MKILRLALCVASVLLGSQAGGEGNDLVRIGVRGDAAPFSYRKGSEQAPVNTLPIPDHSGFMVELCRQTLVALKLRRPNLTVTVKELHASDRFKALGFEENGRDQEDRSNQIDILCDPASINAVRANQLIASSPVFISGVTFAFPHPFPNAIDCITRVGTVRGTTSKDDGVRAILNSGSWSTFSAQIEFSLAEIGNGKDANEVFLDTCEEFGIPIIRKFDTHTELADEFCAGKVLYYVGDIDILRRKVSNVANCNAVIEPRTFTQERYGIFGRSPTATGTNTQLILEFFQILQSKVTAKESDGNSLLISAYNSTFIEGESSADPSVALQSLFWSLSGATFLK
ncbi:MAG: transporter substrate-binding domain-containing protein [Methylocystaceae bacterium]|nr:transporter substrate-binding domain-containing protein [Methylocystaceae bacterium]